MPLDRHAKRFLDMLAIAGPASEASVSVEERRQSFAKLMGFSGRNEADVAWQDRAIPGPGGSIALRVFTPAALRCEPSAGLVYFHGGGMVAGSLDTHHALCAALATASGCRLIAVDYRLAPEHPFPAALDDGYAAALWAARHAADLGIDPARIAVAGDSAGATLAAVLCCMARDARAPSFALQLLLCPITDFEARTPSRQAFADPRLLDKAMMDRDFAQYSNGQLDPADPRVSPLRATDLSGLPPAFLHTGECDPLRDEGRAYADALRNAGVPVSYTCHPGMIHLFYAMPAVVPYARTAVQAIGAELRAALAA
jgi:acetyl esterase